MFSAFKRLCKNCRCQSFGKFKSECGCCSCETQLLEDAELQNNKFTGPSPQQIKHVLEVFEQAGSRHNTPQPQTHTLAEIKEEVNQAVGNAIETALDSANDLLFSPGEPKNRTLVNATQAALVTLAVAGLQGEADDGEKNSTTDDTSNTTNSPDLATQKTEIKQKWDLEGSETHSKLQTKQPGESAVSPSES